MEYQEKTKWLGRYRESVCRQRMLEDELAALRSDAERMTACISGMPGRGGVNADRLPKAASKKRRKISNSRSASVWMSVWM